jgi:hypothetical protein
MKHLLVSVVLCAALAGVVGGCGGVRTPPSPQATVTPPVVPPANSEAALRERVAAFWEARLKNDVVRLYDFLEPEAKKRVPLTFFARSHGTFQFQAYEVTSIKIVGERAWVKVAYTFKLQIPQLAGFGPWTEGGFEVWALRDGVWVRPYGQEGALTPPAESSRIDRSDFA